MGNYYGDEMLLKELISLTQITVGLIRDAENIEISDDFSNNPLVETEGKEINIYCTNEDIVRVININLEKNTITEMFKSPLGIGGTVYSIDGELIKIIN